ncbi:exported hypothetical protein [Candidatus Sulfopaludibacter sp. SbA3]|nr:exported hypothetical protein [Candidatus Sulfopaludibacter sp. SbA3]
MTHKRVTILAGALCLAAVAQDLPVIKVTTRLVQVDVIVRDSKGSGDGINPE